MSPEQAAAEKEYTVWRKVSNRDCLLLIPVMLACAYVWWTGRPWASFLLLILLHSFTVYTSTKAEVEARRRLKTLREGP